MYIIPYSCLLYHSEQQKSMNVFEKQTPNCHVKVNYKYFFYLLISYKSICKIFLKKFTKFIILKNKKPPTIKLNRAHSRRQFFYFPNNFFIRFLTDLGTKSLILLTSFLRWYLKGINTEYTRYLKSFSQSIYLSPL